MFEKLALLENLIWIVLGLGLVFVLYHYGSQLKTWLTGLYNDFTAPGGQAEQDIVNMFTPRNDDGTVAPKDVAPKGVDPIDWIFQNHDLSAPV
jgi:uncharacterized protein involved in cysteine biosynthesis